MCWAAFFFAARRRHACDAVLLWFASYYCVDTCFCAPLRARRLPLDVHREEEPEAAPHGFLRGASRAHGGLSRAPPPRRDGSHAGLCRRPESQMQRLHKVLQRRAHRCPAGARSTRDRPRIECCEVRCTEAARGQHFQP